MDAWIAKATVVLGTVVMIAIRAPHGQRSTKVPVATSRKGSVEKALLTLAWTSFFVPFVWVASPWLSFADYPASLAAYAAGVALLASSLWMFHRSHADLGTNWSITLEIREGHRLVTEGIYRRIRHPMYSALLLYGVGQALVAPNWIAGPSYLVSLSLLVAFRLSAEERMMVERFGPEYESYRARTRRLLPGIW